jgi:soluble lytic murein transglycosylase-like protein
MMLPVRPLGLGVTSDPYSAQMAAAATQYGVPLSLLEAVANQESGYNPNAVGTSGEIGLFQLMPATAAQLGVSNSYDPTQNIQGGAKYLSQLYAQFGSWDEALEAYNEGPGALNAQLAAGVTPTSAGYAASALAAAGISDTSASSIAGATDASDDSGDLADLTDSGDDSGALVALGIVGLFGLWALSR